MRKLIVAIATLAVLVPAGLAGATSKTPRPRPPTRRASISARASAPRPSVETYGTNHNRANAMGKCRSAERKALKKDAAAAKASCKAKGKKHAGATSTCVAKATKAKTKARHKAIVNAAKTCKAERAQDAAAFKTTYGTNANKSNAFGRCVSKHAHSRS